MPVFDGTALSIALVLLGIIGSLIIFIYLQDRKENNAKHEAVDKRLLVLEKERTDIALIKQDIKYIRTSIDELKTRK